MTSENDRRQSIEDHYKAIGNLSVVIMDGSTMMSTIEYVDGSSALAKNTILIITNSDLPSREKGWFKFDIVSVPDGTDERFLHPGDSYLIPVKFTSIVE